MADLATQAASRVLRCNRASINTRCFLFLQFLLLDAAPELVLTRSPGPPGSPLGHSMAGTALRAPCPAAAASRKSSVRLLNSTFLLLAVFALLAGLLDCGSRGLAWQASQAAAEVESYVSRGALGSGQMREAAFIITTDAPHAAMARVRPTVVAAAVPRSLCWLQAWHDLNVFVGRSTNAVLEGVRAPEVDGSRVDGVRGLGHMRAAAFICNYAPHAAADGRSPSVVGASALASAL